MTVGFNVPNAGGLIDGPRGKLHPRTIPRHRMHLLNSHHTQTVHHHPTPLKTSKTKWKFSNCAEKKMHNNSNCTSLTTPHTIVHHQHLKNQKEQRYKQHKMHNLNHIIHNISSSPISSKPTKKKVFVFVLGRWQSDEQFHERRKGDRTIQRRRWDGGGGEEYLLLVALVLSAMEVLEGYGRRLLHGRTSPSVGLLPQTQFACPD